MQILIIDQFLLKSSPFFSAAIFATPETLATRSLSLAQYRQQPLLPDWCNLFQPKMPEDTSLTSLRARASRSPSKQGESQPKSSSAKTDKLGDVSQKSTPKKTKS